MSKRVRVVLLPFKLAPSSRLIRGTPPFRRMSTIAKRQWRRPLPKCS